MEIVAKRSKNNNRVAMDSSKIACIVRGCVSPAQKFSVVPKDYDRRSIWLKILKREDLLLAKGRCRVCYNHFRKEMTVPSGKRLTTTAIPFLEVTMPLVTEIKTEKTDFSYPLQVSTSNICPVPATSPIISFKEEYADSSNSEYNESLQSYFGSDRAPEVKHTEIKRRKTVFREMRPVCATSPHSSSEEYEAANQGACNCLQDLRQQVSSNHAQVMKALMNLAQSVAELRKDVVLTKSSNKIVDNILPSVPFTRMEDAMAFESEIASSSERFLALRNTFEYRGPCDSRGFVTGFIRRLFADEVCKNFTWLGTKTKLSARSLKTIEAMKNAFRIKFPERCDDVFDKIAMRYFHYASDRSNKKAAYSAKIN